MIENIPFESLAYEALLLTVIVTSLIAIHLKDLLYSVIILGILDLALAGVFFILKAPDIAITQVAVCAALSTFVFMIAIYKTERKEL